MNAPTSNVDSGIRRSTGDGAAAAPQAAAPLAHVLSDLVQGARMVELWGWLGWRDVRHRYRRSVLGPFWITISMALMVVLLGTLYGGLLRTRVPTYLPYVTLGLVVWGLLNNLIVDGCKVFVNARHIIHQVNLPLSVQVYRMVWQNLLVFFHNAAVFVGVAIVFSVWSGWVGLLALPGLALICLNGVWVALLVGTLAARFRDLPPIVDSVMRIAFLVTPIIWTPAMLPPDRVLILQLNPLHHMLEVVRAPLLGVAPALESWLAVGLITLMGWIGTIALFGRYRWRVAYWV